MRDLDLREPAILELLAEIEIRREDLLALVDECLAPVFTPAERADTVLAARRRDSQLSDRDYQALFDPVALAAKVAALRELVAALGDEYPGEAAVEAVFERLSRERLAYVVGCEIFRRIAEAAGPDGVRAALVADPQEFLAAGLAML